MTHEETLAEIARLQAENDRLKAIAKLKAKGKVTLKVAQVRRPDGPWLEPLPRHPLP